MLSRIKPIVEAGDADLSTLVQTLSLAFQTDPAVSWIFPDPEVRIKQLPRMFSFFVAADMASGMALHSPDHEVATVWLAPGSARDDFFSKLWLAVRSQ